MTLAPVSVRIPSELDELLGTYIKENGTTKTKVVVEALAQYLGLSEQVPLVRRVVELEQRMAELEVEVRGKETASMKGRR